MSMLRIYGTGKHKKNMNNKSKTTTVLIDIFIFLLLKSIMTPSRNERCHLRRMILEHCSPLGLLLSLRAPAQLDPCCIYSHAFICL